MTSGGAATHTKRRGVAQWAVANVPIVLTLLGLAGYFVVSLSYHAFYSRLGVDPEEVGLGYAESLTRGALAGIALALIILSFAISFVAVTVALGLLRLVLRRFSFVGHSSFSFKGWAQDAIGDFGPYAVSVLTVLLLWLVPDMYGSLADDLRDGKQIRAAYLSRTNPFGVHAHRAALRWLGREPAGSPDARDDLFYLGHSGGISVLYDATSRRVLRIPEGAAVVETQ